MRIECRFRANPSNAVQVTWYKDGHPTVGSYGEIVGGERSRAPDESILKLDATQARAGKYACSAKNAIGRSHIVDVAELMVESPPIVAIR